MRSLFALFVALLLAGVLLAQDPGRNGRRPPRKDATADNSSPDPAPTAQGLLERSHSIIQDLPVELRASVLASMATMAARLDAKLGKQYATELFNLSQQLTDPIAHATAQLAAVRAMTVNNNDLPTAVELFHRMDGVDPAQLTPGLRDPRLQAARFLFPALMGEDFERRFGPRSGDTEKKRSEKKSVNTFETVLEEAKRLQPVGMYPYFAVEQAASGLPVDKENNPLESSFADSEQVFRQSTRSSTANDEFRDMLRSYWMRVPKDLAQTALHDLTNSIVAVGDQGSATVQTFGSNGRQTINLQSSADAALVELVPIMRQLDPQLLDKLKGDRPDFARAVDQVGNGGVMVTSATNGGRGSGNGPSWNGGGISNGGAYNSANRATMARIRNAAQQNPQQAMTMASNITDPTQASMALSMVAGNLANDDPKAAADALQKAQDAAEKISDKSAQLRADISLANSADRIDNDLALRSALETGFNTGNELLRDEIDAQPDQEPSWSQLAMLTSVGMRRLPELTISLIEEVSVPSIKARLLLNAAGSLQQGRRERAQTTAEVKKE